MKVLILKVLWWVKQIFLILIGSFFFLFGIQVMVGAYQLNNPFTFMMSFFSASFIILISLALLAGFIIKAIKALKGDIKDEDEEDEELRD
jgi:heme A synthase